MGGLLYIHLLNYVHINDTTGLLVFKGVVVFEGVYSMSISIQTYTMHTIKHTCLPTNINDFTTLDFCISGISRSSDLQKYKNSRNTEIYKSTVCM